MQTPLRDSDVASVMLPCKHQ